MGNLPVIHEVGTGFQALGDHVTGQGEKSCERWDNYYKESVLGSLLSAAAERRKGNQDGVGEYFRGFGRATGKALLGGGLLRDVPVFHELAVCGESLGCVIGEEDAETARERWKTYLESSVIGAGIGMLAAKTAGDDETAERRRRGFLRAGAKFSVLGLSVAATVATGGIAASYGIVASAVAGAVVGGGIGAASTAATQVIDNGEVDDLGAVVGNGLLGGALIAANGLRVTSNVCANNAAGTYPRGPVVKADALAYEPAIIAKTVEEVPRPKVTANLIIVNFVCPTSPWTPFRCAQIKDVVAVMDGSGSIGSAHFKDGRTALRNMMELELESGNDTRYAAVTFSNTASVNFPFLSYAESAKEITKLRYKGGHSNTQAGLAEAKKLFDDPSSGRRSDATKVVFLVTDGHSNVQEDQIVRQADALKNSGVKIYVVAAGRTIDGLDEMVRIASDPKEKFLYRVENFAGFLRIVKLALEKVAPGKYALKKEQ